MKMKVPKEFRDAFPARPPTAHKYTVGVVSIIGGCSRFPHAPIIAARGARAAGAGLISLAVPDESRFCAGALVPEATFSRILPKSDAVAFGMGLGDDCRHIAKNFREICAHEEISRIIFDADALRIFAKKNIARELAALKNREIIITPHEGEAARLLALSREEISRNRRACAIALAKKLNATVVLKGPNTLVVSADATRVYENKTGNALLALGGTGDLLAGVIAARWAYLKGDAFQAAASSVWLHGLAADTLLANEDDPSLVQLATTLARLRLHFSR